MKKLQIFRVFLFQTIIFGQGLSVAERYGDRIELLGIPFKDPLVLCQILIAIFIAIAFIQSGIDKILDRKGNLEFFKVHFANTFLKNVTPLLLIILTIFELAGGLTLVYGIYFAFVYRTTLWIFYGFVMLALTIILLFAGQRIVKDYLGAADLVPYFILIMLGIMSMY
tara:strand:+ start:506 stop:1009 length:504 start_codon:yes stop_codon:yes gene_type:complete